jgi:hypothetical protein
MLNRHISNRTSLQTIFHGEGGGVRSGCTILLKRRSYKSRTTLEKQFFCKQYLGNICLLECKRRQKNLR